MTDFRLEEVQASFGQDPETLGNSRKWFHRIGLWGTLNSLKQFAGMNSLIAQKQFGGDGADGSVSGGGGSVDANQISKLLDAVPFGGEVNINNFGPTQADAPLPQSTFQPTFRPVSQPVHVPVQAQSPATAATQPAAQPATQPGWSPLAIALLAGLAGAAGIGLPMAAFWPRQPAVVPAEKPVILDGTLEFEVPLSRTTESATSTSSESRSGRGG